MGKGNQGQKPCFWQTNALPYTDDTLDLLHKSEKLTISNFGFWILDFGLRDLGLLQEVY
jgi:hypothetical protein